MQIRPARTSGARVLFLAAVVPLLAVVDSPRAAPLHAQSLTELGVFVETNYSTLPGLEVSLGVPNWLGVDALAAAYSTSRLGIVRQPNALIEDRLQLRAKWTFRADSRLSPLGVLSAGYTRFDREDERLFTLLDNGSPLLSLAGGVRVRFLERVSATGTAGISPLTSSTVYPFVANLGLQYHVGP